MTLAERVLLLFCRRPDQPQYVGGTARTTVDNALDFLIKTVPGFLNLIQDKTVLDFGCGYGAQAAAMAKAGAREVTGVDLPRPSLQERWRAAQANQPPNLHLTTDVSGRQFDVVVSCSSFEHFSDPGAILARMREATRPGGLVIISFAEPWFSPRGSHCDGFTRLPWVNLLFPEKAVLRVRARFKQDGAMRYEDVEGGLNRMTVSKFERLMRSSGMKIRELRLHAVKRLPAVTSVPVARELLTAAASCILENEV